MPMTDAERRAFLTARGLNPDAPGLADAPPPAPPVLVAEAEGQAPATGPSGASIPLAPEGINPLTMPVTDIVFDERLVEGFDLAPKMRSAAASHVFRLYSPGRSAQNKDRNSLLWSEIGKWLTKVHLSRRTGGAVTEKIKVSTEAQELAMMLQAKGVTLADLIALLDPTTAKDES